MPIGNDYEPPGFNPTAHPDIVSRIIFYVGAAIGAVLHGGAAVATALLNALRQESLDLNPNEPISPDACATAVVKGVLPGGDWHGEARLSGVDPPRFDALVAMTGNPPGPETLGAMIRRGIIGRDDFTKGIRQGYIKTEWVDALFALVESPMSAAEALQSAVQGHLSLDAALDIASQNGLIRDQAAILYETFGNPPGPMEMLNLLNRGEMSQADVEQGLRESRLKNKYIPALLKLREYHPPPRTITTLLAHGAVTEAQAAQLFEQAGLSPELASIYAASAVHTKTATHKELAAGTVRSLYAKGVLTRAAAVDDLGKIGYLAPEANLLLDLSDAEVAGKIKDQALNRIRTLYVARKIDKTTANNDVDRLGVHPDQKDGLFALWDLEMSTPTKTLTLGQLNQAYKKGLITRPDFVARVTGLGYDGADADLLANIDVPPSTP